VITVHADDGTRVVFCQIAGLIARRIVCYKKVGDRVQAGERIGLIKFGSRVDVILGPEWSIEVAPGMRVAGGASVLARRAGEIILPDEALAAALVEEAAFCQT
jgi:phosphatidylserine decarboxylase